MDSPYEYRVLDGPSKYDLLGSLLDGVTILRFHVVAHGGNGVIDVRITFMERVGESGEKWHLKGDDRFKVPRHFEATYNTADRTGKLNQEAPPGGKKGAR